MSDKEKMKPEHKIFCHEYVLDWNGTRSYKVAYPNQKTDNSAAANACRLLRNDKIQAYIEEIQKDIAKLAGISKLGVLNKLSEIIENDNTEEVATRDKIKALEVQNKMLGFNEAEKQTITSKREIVNVNLTKTTTPPITNESDLFDDD